MGARVKALLFQKKVILECKYLKPQIMKRFSAIPIILTLALLIYEFPHLAYAQESEIYQNAEHWQSVKKKDGVTVSRRTLILNGLESRETKVSTHMDLSLESIIGTLSGNSDIWATLGPMRGVQDFNVNSDKSFWNSYVVIDMPWPIKNQDLVIQSRIAPDNNGNIRRIEVEGVPDLIPEENRLTRIQYYKCVWLLEAIDKNTTHVQCISTSQGKPKFPRWITDPIVYKNLITLLENLRVMSAETLAFHSNN